MKIVELFSPTELGRRIELQQVSLDGKLLPMLLFTIVWAVIAVSLMYVISNEVTQFAVLLGSGYLWLRTIEIIFASNVQGTSIEEQPIDKA